jgi:hypothetical protein
VEHLYFGTKVHALELWSPLFGFLVQSLNGKDEIHENVRENKTELYSCTTQTPKRFMGFTKIMGFGKTFMCHGVLQSMKFDPNMSPHTNCGCVLVCIRAEFAHRQL